MASRIKSNVIEFNRGVNLCFSSHFLKISSYHSHFASIENNLRNDIASKRLVSRRNHLILTWEVHPELHCMLRSASARESLCHKLIMEKSASCCHPLHFIWPNYPTTSSSILMLYLSGIHDCYRFESSMRMKSYSWTVSIFLRRNMPWSVVVKHEKRTGFIRHFSTIPRNILRNPKSITNHMIFLRMFQASNSFLHI